MDPPGVWGEMQFGGVLWRQIQHGFYITVQGVTSVCQCVSVWLLSTLAAFQGGLADWFGFRCLASQTGQSSGVSGPYGAWPDTRQSLNLMRPSYTYLEGPHPQALG